MANMDASAQALSSTPGTRDTPSSELASSTLKALGPITTATYPADMPYHAKYPSIPPTPSDKIPGSYPRGPVDPQALSQDVKSVKEAAAHAVETAKEYAYSAGEAVGRYLPDSVAPYLHHTARNGNTQAPHHHALNEVEDSRSEELPGPHGEFLADAQVPDDVETAQTEHSSDQRQEDNVLFVPDNMTFGGRSFLNVDDQRSTVASSSFQGASENASTRSLPGSRADPWNYTPGTSLRSPSRRDSMRNTDGSMKTSFSASPGLVAAQQTQTDLDDTEKQLGQDENVTSEQADHECHGEEATSATEVRPIPESSQFRRISPSPKHSPHGQDQGHIEGNVAGSPTEVENAGDRKNIPRSSHNIHQSDLVNAERTSPTAVNISHTSNDPIPMPYSDTSNTQGASVTQTPSKSKFGSTNGKPGFMDKLRGEIMILSDKLEHSNDKIEEGRKLMGKVSKS